MYSDSDIASVFQFLKDTPEGPLRKMMVGADLTENQFRLFLKVVRGCPEPIFIEMFKAEDFPKIRMTPAELPMRETLWPICKKKLAVLGLLAASTKAAA
jgi:hypothetical protein